MDHLKILKTLIWQVFLVAIMVICGPLSGKPLVQPRVVGQKVVCLCRPFVPPKRWLTNSKTISIRDE